MNTAISTETHDPDAPHVYRDDYGTKMGMWLFLFTELLLFGGMFILYMAYRIEYFVDFQVAAKELKVYMGTVNTIILLTSSLTMVLSIVALQRGSKKLSMTWLGTTIALAFGFLIVKYFEWSAKIADGIFPDSPELTSRANGEIIFYGLYYVMTGLHGIHVIIGMILLGFMFVQIWRDKYNKDYYVKLENGGLYWHLVDLIWIFLFPLFYLLH